MPDVLPSKHAYAPTAAGHLVICKQSLENIWSIQSVAAQLLLNTLASDCAVQKHLMH